MAAALLLLLAGARDASPLPVVQSARVSIAFASPTACEVTIEHTLAEAAASIEHRVQTFDGTRVELIDVRGARPAGSVRTIGRTEALNLQVTESAYGFQYRVQQPEARAYRCPIWLATAATTGRPDAVRLQVEIPPGMAASQSMPAFTWTGSRGAATLANVPSAVRVEFAAAGAAPPWTVRGAMDTLAMSILTAATALWLWRVRRGLQRRA